MGIDTAGGAKERAAVAERQREAVGGRRAGNDARRRQGQRPAHGLCTAGCGAGRLVHPAVPAGDLSDAQGADATRQRGVQEVFIFCCAHSAEIERYIRESELELRLATLRLHVLAAKGQCFSTGDALREVEAHGGITNDFVLVPGDVVANLQLAPIIAAHKARRESDRDSVLTTLMARVPPRHRSRRAGDEVLVALSGETGRLLRYEDGHKSVAGCKLELPMNVLQACAATPALFAGA
eukprot:scaffold6285_cov121-Isochrysis_galbana.AAC.20